MSRHKRSTISSTSVARMFCLPLEQEGEEEGISCYANLFSPIYTTHTNSNEMQALLRNTKHEATVFFDMREGKHRGLPVWLHETQKLHLSNSYVCRKWKTIIYHPTWKTIFSSIRLLAAKCLTGLLVNHKREHLQLKHQCQAMIST